MTHGLAGELTHFITEFASFFAEAGLDVLVYDHRGWGRSGTAPGMPRNESDPWQQVRDYQHAITYVQNRPDVDPDRLGAWGIALSAGHVFVLGAIDQRLKAVAGQVPFISGHRHVGGLIRSDFASATHQTFADDRRARAHGEAPGYMPVTDKDPMAVSALPTADTYDYFFGENGVIKHDPGFANIITVRTMEYCYGYEPGWYLPRVSPTPLLMVVALGDHLTSSDLALAAFETAAQPKQLLTLPGGHFDTHRGRDGERAKTVTRDFFVQHLAQ